MTIVHFRSIKSTTASSRHGHGGLCASEPLCEMAVSTMFVLCTVPEPPLGTLPPEPYYRLMLAMASKLCQGPALTKAGSENVYHRHRENDE